MTTDQEIEWLENNISELIQLHNKGLNQVEPYIQQIGRIQTLIVQRTARLEDLKGVVYG